MEDPNNPANDGYRCDDHGNNTAVSPESFVEMIFISWGPSRRLRGWVATAKVIVSHSLLHHCCLKTRKDGLPFLLGRVKYAPLGWTIKDTMEDCHHLDPDGVALRLPVG
jgi:hypothetical protein